MHRIILALALLLPAVAPAQSTAPSMKVRKFGRALSGVARVCDDINCQALTDVAGNAAAASRTFQLPVAGYSKLSIWVDVTEGDMITAVTNSCSASPNGGTSYARINATSVTGGTGTVVNYTDSYATTQSDVVLFEYDVRTYDHFKCVVAITGGGATDSFDVYATAAVGQ